MDLLTGQKAKMDQLIIAVHNFLADLGSSSVVDDKHLELAEQLKNDIVSLYAQWDGCSSRAKDGLVKTEQAVIKLQEIERELLEFRKSLRAKQMQLLQKSPKKSRKAAGSDYSSHDSGISDASSSVLSDYGLPEALDHLTKLQTMTRNLELTLSPHDPTLLSLSRVLNDTSLELDDLQNIYRKQKCSRRRATKKMKSVNKDKLRPLQTSPSRLGKYTKITLTIQAMIMSLMFLSWLCQPQCCDNISAISFTPSLKFVNGPPPI